MTTILAELKEYNGSPAIIVDGRALPPMAVTTHIYDKHYLSELGRAGIKLFYVRCELPNRNPTAMEELTGKAALVLESVPEAYLALRLVVAPPAESLRQKLLPKPKAL